MSKLKSGKVVDHEGGKYAEDLIGLLRPVTALKPDPRNARRRDEGAVGAIMQSISKFGQMKPVVATDDGTVIAGNGLFEAAKRLKWAKIAAVIVEIDQTTATGYAVADNRIGDLSYFDDETLSELIGELADSDPTAIIGWTDDELAEMLGTEGGGKKGPEGDEDDLHRKKDELGSDHLVMIGCSKQALEAVLAVVNPMKEELGVSVEVS